VDGHQFARSLGLRSTRFTATVDHGVATPLPAVDEEPIQELPDQAAAVAVRPVKVLDDDMVLGPASGDAATALTPPVTQALDPRRHPATLLALVLLAIVGGTHLGLVMASGDRRARTFARWKALRPRR
jgi:hypothetical protein